MVYTITQVHSSKKEKNELTYCVWQEVLLAVIFNIPFLTHGLESSNLTTSAHSGHLFISQDDEQWTTTAMIVAAGVTAPLYCYIVDTFGRRMGIFTISFVQGVTLIPHFLLNSENVYNVRLFLHVLAGMSSGGLFTILPIYIREISVLSGFCTGFMIVLTTLGYVMKLAMPTEVRLYLMLVLVCIQFFSIFLMPESPSFLVMREKYDLATRSLSQLRRLKEDDPNISSEISNLKDERDRARSNGKISVYAVYRMKIWLDAIKIVFVLYTINILCGSIIFLDQDKTLIQLKMSADPENILVLSSLMGGSVCCLICITFLDRKYLLTIGYVIMTLSTGVLAVDTQVDLTIHSYRMIPVISLGILVFGYGITWGLPTIIAVEMYNMEIRATFIGIVYAYSQVIKLLHVLTFRYLEDYVGIYTMFYIFACVNLYGAVYTLFAVPNTKCKTIKQIEKQLKRPALPA